MEGKLRRGHPLRDVAVALLGAAACAACLFALYQDINASGQASDRKPAGILVLKKRVAQRKPADRVVWLPLEPAGVVYELDTIRTEAGSEALIRLSDDTEILLAESSMVLLDFSEGGREVEFVEGSIIARRAEGASATTAAPGEPAAPKVTIKAEGTVVDLGSGGTVDMSRDKGKAVALGVSGGSVTLHGKEGDKVVGPAQSASLSAGASALAAVTLSPLFPAAGQAVFGPGPLVEVPFSWAATEARPPFTVEASRGKAFSSKESVESESTGASFSLAPGDWFWRVRDASGALSRALAVKVVADQEPRALAPADGEAFRFRSSPPPVVLRWEPVQDAAAYAYELATDEGFSRLVASGRANRAQATVELQGEGRYAWRVRALYDYAGIGEGRLSAPRFFSLERSPAPIAPKPASPAEGARMDAAEAASGGLVFVWESSPEAVSYELLVESAKGGPSQAWTGGQSFTKLRLDGEPGDYSWRVRALAADGTASAFSEGRSLVLLAKTAPSPGSPLDGTEIELAEAASLVFSWTGSPDAVLHLSRSADLSGARTREGLGNRLSVSLAEAGDYYWALSLPGSKADPGTARHLSVLAPLGQARLVSPGNDASLRLAGVPRLTLEWTAVAGATGYRVVLRKAGLVEPLADIVVQEASASFPVAALSPGDYAWSVRPEQAREGRPARYGPGSLGAFGLLSVRSPPAAVMTSPGEGEALNGVAVLRSGLRLAWKASEPEASYRLRVERKEDGTIVLDEATKALAASMSNPGPGEYRWTLGGEAVDGTPLPEASGSFSVAAIAPLDAPAIKSPRTGSIVDMTKADALVLSWSKVSGATAYELVLKDRKTGRLVFSRIVEKATELVFRDLEKLDVGEFTLSIRALSLGPGGAVERSSPVRSASFTISVASPKAKPAIIGPKDVYVQQP